MCKLLIAIATACLLSLPSLGHGEHHHHHHRQHHGDDEEAAAAVEPWEEQVAVTWAVSERRLKRAALGAAPAAPAAPADPPGDASHEEFTVQFTANGKQYSLELQRNRALIAQGAKHTLVDRDGRQRDGPMPRACFYQGSVVGDPKGRVGVSTCKGGFSGLIIAHGEMISISQVLEQGRAEALEPSGVRHHRVRRLTESQVLEYERDVQQFLRAPPNWTKDRRLTPSETKYVEAFVFNDYSRYLSFGGAAGVGDLAEQSVSIMNTVTALYKTDPADSASFPFVIQVVFVGQQTFVEADPWDETVAMIGEETDCNDLLRKFHEWARDELAAGEAAVSNYDNRILLSGRDFDGNTIGLAHVSAMCWPAWSGNINMCVATSDVGVCASVVSHEMGHNFGMMHDSSDNDCVSSGFIMEAITDGDPTTQFSSCSAAYIANYFNSTYADRGECLENAPTRVEGDPICGNGFIEIGEECDCGSSDCSALNPCCDGTTCTLADPSYECATGDCCSDSCMFITAESTTVCRAAASSCDLAEYCPGGTDECPRDRFSYPGESCTIDGYEGLCSDGACNSLGYTCGVTLTQDFSGNYDTSEVCSQFVDACSYMVCHDKDEAENAYACSQGFSLHGKQIQVPDGTPCWFPATQLGTRSGMCYDGSCVLPEALATVPDCGNGGIDFGEECDCGNATTDSCCECSTCKLKEGMECSSQEACCDDTCHFKAAGTECRAAEGSCDIAETCTGSSGVCPSDVGQTWGTACTASDGITSTCYGKICVDSFDMQCNAKYMGARPYGYPNGADGKPSSYHQCEGLMCCNTTHCTKNKAYTTFVDGDGNENQMRVGGALDGTVLNDATKVCVHGLETTPNTTCSDGYFLSVAVGQCVACSTGCTTCNGPSVFDCTGGCKYGQDSRGACAISAHQVSYLVTTTQTVTVTTSMTSSSSSTTTTTTAGPEVEVTTTADAADAPRVTTTSDDTAGETTTTVEVGDASGSQAATTTVADDGQGVEFTTTAGGATPGSTTTPGGRAATSTIYATTTQDDTVAATTTSSTGIASTSQGEGIAATTTGKGSAADPTTSSASSMQDEAGTSTVEATATDVTSTAVVTSTTQEQLATSTGAEDVATSTRDEAAATTTKSEDLVTSTKGEANQATTTMTTSFFWNSASSPSTTLAPSPTTTTNSNGNSNSSHPIIDDGEVNVPAPWAGTSTTAEASEEVATTTTTTTTTVEVDTTVVGVTAFTTNIIITTSFDPASDVDGPTKTSTTKATTSTLAPEKVEFTSTVEGIDFNQLMGNDGLQQQVSDTIVDTYAENFGLPTSCFAVEFSEGSVQVDTIITLPTEEEQEAQGLTTVPTGADLVESLTDSTASASLQASIVTSIMQIPAISEVTTGAITISAFLIATTTTQTQTTSVTVMADTDADSAMANGVTMMTGLASAVALVLLTATTAALAP